MMTLKIFVREARANLANHLIRLRLFVEASEMERSVDSGTFASPKVGANHDEIERVAHASEVILLELVRTTNVRLQYATRELAQYAP